MTVLGMIRYLKDRLLILSGVVIGVLIFYINVLQKAALRKEIKQTKSVSKAKDKSIDALKEGLDNETKSTDRGYFDSK